MACANPLLCRRRQPSLTAFGVNVVIYQPSLMQVVHPCGKSVGCVFASDGSQAACLLRLPRAEMYSPTLLGREAVFEKTDCGEESNAYHSPRILFGHSAATYLEAARGFVLATVYTVP